MCVRVHVFTLVEGRHHEYGEYTMENTPDGYAKGNPDQIKVLLYWNYSNLTTNTVWTIILFVLSL